MRQNKLKIAGNVRMLSDSYMILITSDQCDPKLFLGVEEMT